MVNLQRPGAVSILVVLDAALGALILFAALVMGGQLLGMYPSPRGVSISSSLSLAITIAIVAIDFVLAFGVWSGRKWAWYSSLGFSAIDLVATVFVLFLRPRPSLFFSLLIDLILLYLLMQPGVQQYCARDTARLTASGVPVTKSRVTQSG